MTRHEQAPRGTPQDTRMLHHVLETWPIRVFYQHQGMCVSTWLHLRRALGPTMGLRIVKGSQVPHVFPGGIQPRIYFQGSCCVVGLHRLEDMATLHRICAMYPQGMVLLGGHWYGEYWTHWDVQHVAHLPHPSLLHQQVCDTLHQGLQGVPTSLEASQRYPIESLQTPTHTLLTLLQQVGDTPI